jgi:hypothetical protein
MPGQKAITPKLRTCAQNWNSNGYFSWVAVVVELEAKKSMSFARKLKLIFGPALKSVYLNP